MYIVLIVLIVVLVLGLPRFDVHSFGYYPSGVTGLLILLLCVLLLTGRL